MVSVFTLGVSITSGVYFALGGYWNTLFAAVLSVLASILDGCDGEVARLKLQSSAFGCWLETMCDYLYYLVVFAGMAVGLVRSTGRSAFYGWGAALLFGAVVTFVVASLGRQRLSGKRPEQYLAVWQKNAERRSSNPIFYIGRQLEFIIRRCFMPYALLAFAVLNLTAVPLVVGAVGANMAWVISLCSYLAFSVPAPVPITPTGPTHAATPVIVECR
jgi:phosphatidylglycerophosphate synthase